MLGALAEQVGLAIAAIPQVAVTSGEASSDTIQRLANEAARKQYALMGVREAAESAGKPSRCPDGPPPVDMMNSAVKFDVPDGVLKFLVAQFLLPTPLPGPPAPL
jgi:hypothetical protein